MGVNVKKEGRLHTQQPLFHPFFRIFGSRVQQTACIRQITAATAPIPIQNTGSTFIRFIMAIAPFISRLSLVVHCSSFWKEPALSGFPEGKRSWRC